MQRGLRQGDPLSPFPFILAGEGFNILFRIAKEKGFVKGTKIEINGLSLTHLRFADDTILFCEADIQEVTTIRRILKCFEVMSGLKVNFFKSTVSGIGIENDLLKEFAGVVKCKS